MQLFIKHKFHPIFSPTLFFKNFLITLFISADIPISLPCISAESSADSTKIKVTAILFHITVNTIQGNANYSGLLGDAIIEDANKLFAGIEELRKSDPNTYSFVTPKLKDKRFKASHKSATDENISDLKKLDQLRIENQISGLEFVKSVEEVVKQKEMWEIYQKESLEWYSN